MTVVLKRFTLLKLSLQRLEKVMISMQAVSCCKTQNKNLVRIANQAVQSSSSDEDGTETTPFISSWESEIITSGAKYNDEWVGRLELLKVLAYEVNVYPFKATSDWYAAFIHSIEMGSSSWPNHLMQWVKRSLLDNAQLGNTSLM